MGLRTIQNSLGRKVPVEIPEIGEFKPYSGSFAYLTGQDRARILPPFKPQKMLKDKLTDDVRKAVRRSGLENGMTISFHHHLRNGDNTVPFILEEVAEDGF